MQKCYKCLTALEIKTPVGRKDVCPSCGADLRCCLNCVFYAPQAYNGCREPQADRVVEKERSNFCDYFSFGNLSSDRREGDTAKAKLESLFK